jgi:hypothetical protein
MRLPLAGVLLLAVTPAFAQSPAPVFVPSVTIARPAALFGLAPVVLRGNRLFIAGDRVVYQFDRQPDDTWIERESVAVNLPGFGSSIDYDGQSLVALADGVAFVFRELSDVWVIRAQVSGDFPPGTSATLGGGLFAVHTRMGVRLYTLDGALVSTPIPVLPMVGTWDFDGDRFAVVPSISTGSMTIWARDGDQWGVEHRLGFTGEFPFSPFVNRVHLQGDVALLSVIQDRVGASPVPDRVLALRRHPEDGWVTETVFQSTSVPIGLDGDGARGAVLSTSGTSIIERDAGGWTERAVLPGGSVVTVNGDTVVVGSAGQVRVFVRDGDGDGVRDSRDECPADPQNECGPAAPAPAPQPAPTPGPTVEPTALTPAPSAPAGSTSFPRPAGRAGVNGGATGRTARGR